MFEEMTNKFIVLNKKRFQEMNNLKNWDTSGFPIPNRIHPAVEKFLNALDDFNEAYESVTGNELHQEYIVCNQDEPYAKIIWEIIKTWRNGYEV